MKMIKKDAFAEVIKLDLAEGAVDEILKFCPIAVVCKTKYTKYLMIGNKKVTNTDGLWLLKAGENFRVIDGHTLREEYSVYAEPRPVIYPQPNNPYDYWPTHRILTWYTSDHT